MGEARGWAGSPEMVEEALGWHSVSKNRTHPGLTVVRRPLSTLKKPRLYQYIIRSGC